MAVRTLGQCSKCAFWRGEDNEILAASPEGRSRGTGECRRRLQTDETGLAPRQPVTPDLAGCSEHVVLPAPERLAPDCGGCRFWRELPPAAPGRAREGLCVVWAPRWSDAAGGLRNGKAAVPGTPMAGDARYAWPITPSTFFCGDGVNRAYRDPEEDEDGEGG